MEQMTAFAIVAGLTGISENRQRVSVACRPPSGDLTAPCPFRRGHHNDHRASNSDLSATGSSPLDVLVGSVQLSGGAVSASSLMVGKGATIIGFGLVSGPLADGGSIKAQGGVLDITGAVSGAGLSNINANATLELDAADSAPVKFLSSTTGSLELLQSQSFTGSVSGLGAGDSLDLRDISFVSAGEATFSGKSSGGTLTVSDGTHQAKINLIGNYMASIWTASSDGHGGTIVVDPRTTTLMSQVVSGHG